PLSFTARARAAQGKENSLGVSDLVERRRAFRAIAAAAARMVRIALELANLVRLVIDVRQEAARGLAIEARRRREAVASSTLGPVVPPLDRWKGRESLLHPALIGRVQAFSWGR